MRLVFPTIDLIEMLKYSQAGGFNDRFIHDLIFDCRVTFLNNRARE